MPAAGGAAAVAGCGEITCAARGGNGTRRGVGVAEHKYQYISLVRYWCKDGCFFFDSGGCSITSGMGEGEGGCHPLVGDPLQVRPGLQNLGAESVFRPPERSELVLSIGMGCADTVPFQRKPNTPFCLGQFRSFGTDCLPPHSGAQGWARARWGCHTWGGLACDSEIETKKCDFRPHMLLPCVSRHS